MGAFATNIHHFHHNHRAVAFISNRCRRIQRHTHIYKIATLLWLVELFQVWTNRYLPAHYSHLTQKLHHCVQLSHEYTRLVCSTLYAVLAFDLNNETENYAMFFSKDIERLAHATEFCFWFIFSFIFISIFLFLYNVFLNLIHFYRTKKKTTENGLTVDSRVYFAKVCYIVHIII